MARVIGPDDQYRTFYYTSGPKAGKELFPPGTPVPLYADAQASIPADVLGLDNSTIAGTPPTVLIGAAYQVPQFKYPDGVRVVYTRVLGGPVVALYALADDRLDAVEASLTGLGNAATRAVGATAGTVAAGDDTRIVNAIQPTGYTGERLFEIAFPGAAANQKADIVFGGGDAYTFTTVEVTVTGIYEDQNATGTIRAVYSLASNFGTTFSNDMVYTVVQGALPDHFALSPAVWDSGSHQWKISVAHLTTSANAVSVRVQWQAPGPAYADAFLDSLSVSAVHTTDPAVPPAAALPIQPTHPIAPAYNATPVNLGKWRAALGAMRQGSGQAKILCVGDSTTIGYGVSVQGSWPSWLPRMLNAPAVAGFAVARHPAIPDSRWTLGAGWNYSNGIGFGRASAYVATTAASGALAFNPGIEFDTVDVYFAGDPANGTSVVTINGTTTNLVSGLTAGFRKQTITRTAGRHTVTIAPPTGGQMVILGIDAYLSTASQIRVGNAGASGTSTQEWAYQGDAWNSIAGLATYDPDLTVFMLGINDTSVPVSREEFRANIETFGAAAETHGSFLLMSVIPSQDSGAAALEAGYRDVMRELSAARGWPMVDIYERFGSYTIANGLGFMSDEIHGSATGYADLASAVAAVLNSLDDSVSARIAAKTVDVQTFTSSGTWTKPAGAVAVSVVAIGSGAGGGSGRRGAAGSDRYGGGGGSAATRAEATFAASAVTKTVDVAVAAGGAGGAAITANDTNGAAGTFGTGSSFGDYLNALGGFRGFAGTAASGPGGYGLSAAGAGSGGAGGAGAGGNTDRPDASSPAGGGGGGGVSSADTAGNGGTYNFYGSAGFSGGDAGVVDAAAPTAGIAATAGIPLGGGGGGGGAGSITAAAQAGAAGGRYGGGGGGGGGSLNGHNSGAGGQGGDGIVVVTTWF